jgi:hypothetical protein
MCFEHGPCPPVDDDEVSAMALDSRGHVFLGLGLFDRNGSRAHLDASVRRLLLPPGAR